MVEPIFYSVLTRWKLNYEIVRSGWYKIIYDVLNVKSEICKRKLSSFVQIIRNIVSLELILGGSFRGCSRMGEKGQTDRICHTYPSMMKLGTVILYLKNIRKKLPSYLIVLDFNFYYESSGDAFFLVICFFNIWFNSVKSSTFFPFRNKSDFYRINRNKVDLQIITWFGGIKTFWAKKITQEKLKKFIKIF